MRSSFLGRLDESSGDSNGARVWFEKYLERSPNGTYAAEALGRIMTLVARSRGAAKARPMAEEYVRRFPNGSYRALGSSDARIALKTMYSASAYLGVLWFLTFALWSESVRAQSVAIVWAASDSGQTLETATRLRGECLAMGIAVAGVEERRESVTDAQSWRASVAPDAERGSKDAVMDVSVDGAVLTVEVWLLADQHQPTMTATLQELETTPNAAEKLAIRAAEALHSRFVEQELLPAEVTPHQAVPTTQRPAQNPTFEERPRGTQKPSRQHMGLAAGGAMLVGTNGLSSAFVPRLQFEWPGSSWLYWQVSIAGLGTQSQAQTSQGSARVSRHYALVGGMYQAEVAFLRPFIGVALGAMVCTIEGSADAPLRAHDEQRVVGLGEFTVGSQVNVSDQAYLALTGHVHLAQPGVAIYVVDERAATAASPSWALSLGLGVRL